MEQDILTKLFAEELGQGYETTNQYYVSYIQEIEEPDDIKEFAETLVEELRNDYDGDLSEDERSKFHYALIFNSMTIAWKKMLNHQIQQGEEDRDFLDEDDLDITKGLVSDEHYTKMVWELKKNEREDFEYEEYIEEEESQKEFQKELKKDRRTKDEEESWKSEREYDDYFDNQLSDETSNQDFDSLDDDGDRYWKR